MLCKIFGSALVFLGVVFGNVEAWLFIVWVCIQWLVNANAIKEIMMVATFKTGVEALAVLWALDG